MIVQDEYPSHETVAQLLADPSKRNKVVKILLQSLNSMGFKNTAQALQNESKVTLQSAIVAQVRQHLSNGRYQLIPGEINTLNLPHEEVKKSLKELEELVILELIDKGAYDVAIEQLGVSQMSEEEKLSFYQVIGLGGSSLTKTEIQRRKEVIIELAERQSVDPGLFETVITNKVLVNQWPNAINEPPTAIVAVSERPKTISGRVNFLKFNKDQRIIAMISQTPREFSLVIWQIKGASIEERGCFKKPTIGYLTSVKWGPSKEGEVIGLCSYDRVQIFRVNNGIHHCTSISRHELRLGRFLAFDWRPNSESLYVSGLFGKIPVFNALGDRISTVAPFIASNNILFMSSTQLLASSCSKGRLIKYDIQHQKEVGDFTCSCCIMDIKHNRNMGQVIATSNSRVYCLNSDKLTVIHSLQSPSNPRLLRIQGFFCNKWILVFNQTLNGVLHDEKMIKYHSWENSEAVDVSESGKLVCFKNSLRVYSTMKKEEVREQMDSQLENEFSEYVQMSQSDDEEAGESEGQWVDQESVSD